MRRISVLAVVLALSLIALLQPVMVIQSQCGVTGGAWNNDGDFDLDPIDTGNIKDQCYIDALWGSNSWGVEGSTFSDPTDYTINWSRFAILSSDSDRQGYLHGKEESGKWGLVRYIQGDVWGGSNCGPIPWNRPEPLLTYGNDLALMIHIYRDTNILLTSNDSWIMFAINLWFSSPDLPSGGDISEHKPLVMELIFYHDCNWNGCGYGPFEDDDAFHYQVFISETPYGGWGLWSIALNDYIQEALNYPWPSGSIADAEETLELYQLEFVIELKNAVGAATIDDFFLYTPCKVYLPLILKSS